ncbi:xylose isomerase [Candidatus Fermentibacteria bacterium]|nr:xylose isomerase [Candidatus Fermentibacteria bacterium]
MTGKSTRPARYQSVCRWSFHPGRGGFVPSDVRPGFAGMTPEGFVDLVREKIAPRVPSNTVLGLAVHYEREACEKTAAGLVEALKGSGLFLSMISPGAHYHFAYGGIGSPDPAERKAAGEFAMRALDLLTGPLSSASLPDCPAVFDVWNGSLGYEIPTLLLTDMLRWADEAIAGLVTRACTSIPRIRVGVEPKPSEGHPAMLYQTSSDVLALRGRLRSAGVDVSGFGLINEFGHTEMSGLDLVQDYAAALLEGAVVHIHANSQGGDGIRLGGAGKFDIDFGTAPSATTLAIAGMLSESGYAGWVEHDMQPRPYDSEQQSIDRVVRSVCNWEALMRVVESGLTDRSKLLERASARRTMELEDLVRDAVARAHELSKELYVC